MSEHRPRKSLPLTESFPDQKARMQPKNPASWPMYQRYATEQLLGKRVDPWPDNHEKRNLHIDTVAALATAGDYVMANRLARHIDARRTEKLRASAETSSFQNLQLKYWCAYLGLVENAPDITDAVLDMVNIESPLHSLPEAQLTDKEFELKYDFLLLQSLLKRYLGDFGAAKSQQDEILRTLSNRFGIKHPKVIDTHHQLAHTHRLLDKHETAHDLSTKLADRLDGLPGYGQDHTLTIHNRFFALVDTLAQRPATKELMSELGQCFVRHRLNYPEHTHTFLLLKDYAATELRCALDIAETDTANYLHNVFLSRAAKHAGQAYEGLKARGLRRSPEIQTMAHPEALHAAQIIKMCLSLDDLTTEQLFGYTYQMSIKYRANIDIQGAYCEFGIYNMAFALNVSNLTSGWKKRFGSKVKQDYGDKALPHRPKLVSRLIL